MITFSQQSVEDALKKYERSDLNAQDIYELYFFSNPDNMNRVLEIPADNFKITWRLIIEEISSVLYENNVISINDSSISRQYKILGLNLSHQQFLDWLQINFPTRFNNSSEIWSLITGVGNE